LLGSILLCLGLFVFSLTTIPSFVFASCGSCPEDSGPSEGSVPEETPTYPWEETYPPEETIEVVPYIVIETPQPPEEPPPVIYGEELEGDECCEFTSITIQNVWNKNREIRIIVTSEAGVESVVVDPRASHTFTGDMGKCIRITVQSTDPRQQHLLIEDVRVCCKDLQEGRYPRFYSILFMRFDVREIEVCEARPEPPPEEPPPPPEHYCE